MKLILDWLSKNSTVVMAAILAGLSAIAPQQYSGALQALAAAFGAHAGGVAGGKVASPKS